MQGCFVDGSSNDCSAVPGTCMLSYSNDQLALVNQCGVLSFHSSDSVIQYVAILCAIRAKLSGQVDGRSMCQDPFGAPLP